MEIINFDAWFFIPEDFSGIAFDLNEEIKYWFLNGSLHREDGPAVEYGQGETFKGYGCWYLNGSYYDTKEKWFQALNPQQKENVLWSLELWN